MEFKNVVFNAARDGKLSKLKFFLEHRPSTEVHELLRTRIQGATPLLVACRNGHFQVAEYLITKCKADIELTGSVNFDGEMIEDAPPLWVAAAAGHEDIVKLLVEHGANVNSTTRTNSTPLRAACFDGHLRIVMYLVDHKADVEIANRHGHTCLMIACFKGHYEIAAYLISLKADVNRKSGKGNTALHDCAESGSLDILRLLLNNGAKMDVDAYGMTPLLAASVTGHAHIVEYLITLSSVSNRERIEALELLGATYLDKKRDFMEAARLWGRALDERERVGLLKCPHRSLILAFENSEEIQTRSDLERTMADPDAMRMQALLVRERILGPAHPDTAYWIRYRGAVYADAGDIRRCINLWMYALEMQQLMLEPLSVMTQSSLLSFAELFAYMLNKGITGTCDIGGDMLGIFRSCLKELENAPKEEHGKMAYHKMLLITLHMACLLVEYFRPRKSAPRAVLASLYKLLKMNAKGRDGNGSLHLAVSRESSTIGRYPICSFPNRSLVYHLLDLGTDVDARNDAGDTPLHVAARNNPSHAELLHILLKRGAHPDIRNSQGKTFSQILWEQSKETVNLVPFVSLQCLAARVVKDRCRPACIPPHLVDFVNQH